jgi:lysozyme family protein
MPTVELTPALKDEYQHLFDTCIIHPERAQQMEHLVAQIVQHQPRYTAVGDPLGIPWYVIGVIHSMEASLNFNTHLHNGDPLTARTVHVPAGRPQAGQPPFTWEESATDALQVEQLDHWRDWSIPGMLYRLEGYNGFGYRLRHPEVLSPYLWSFSNHYVSGKYVADGTFSPSAVSEQCGAAVLLRRMAEIGTMQFDAAGMTLPPSDQVTGGDPLARFEPMIRFSRTERSPLAEELQRALNRFPGIFVNIDGIPGPRTSDAFKKVTGHYLLGDPRA